MASGEEILSALSSLGFDNAGGYYYGTWKGYAVTLRKITAKSFFADLAVRLDKIPGGLRRALAAAVKEKGLKLDAAQAQIRHNRDGVDKRFDAIEQLKDIKNQLLAFQNALDELFPDTPAAK